MSAAARERLRQLFLERAVLFGDFTLASGKKSKYYINSKRVLFHAEAITLLGELLYDATRDLEFQAIGGLEVGAIPMAAATLVAYHRAGRHLEGFFVRKQAKGHGSQELVEGQVKPGDAVVVIDDVLTTGGSAVQAVEAVKAVGATVARVVCICDRLQGAREALAGYDFRPLYTIRDFGIAEPSAEKVELKASSSGRFELRKGASGKYHFNLKAANGQVILSSETYNDKAGAEGGIASVQSNAADDGRYERKASKNGEPYFVLKAGNGQIIGKSEMYSSVAAMEKGIASVKANGAGASVQDLTAA